MLLGRGLIKRGGGGPGAVGMRAWLRGRRLVIVGSGRWDAVLRLRVGKEGGISGAYSDVGCFVGEAHLFYCMKML